MLPTLKPGARQTLCERAARILETWIAGKSDATVGAYAADLEVFRQWSGASSSDAALAALLALGPARAHKAAERWRDSMPGAPRTVARRLSMLRSLVRCAQREEAVRWTLEVETPKARGFSRDTRGPEPRAVARVLAALELEAEAGSELGVRDLAVLLLLADCALRRGEVCSLEVRHVDLARASVFVREKGGADNDRKWWPMTRRTASAMGEWLELRGRQPGPVFCAVDARARRGTVALAPSSVYRIVRGRAEAVGLRGFRPHGLRHTAATTIHRETGDLVLAQRVLRHSSPETTARHYLDPEPEELRQLLELVASSTAADPHVLARGLPRGVRTPLPPQARQR